MLGPFSTLTAAIKEAIRLIPDTAALLLDEFDVKQVAQAQADMKSCCVTTIKGKTLSIGFEIMER